ncbi:hypothetical protein QUF79_07565 [Fictibacillus enclensis]|uniref:hypothetical protein n=1 Tax=Fictibacillus enclensis TaxID=1017270 RepID=UPI0025A1ED62|nr:hypothetical protein [Fictibacillus enclensis]MDM5197871.1 hypothetical protein [Fictibacillus enclensis]
MTMKKHMEKAQEIKSGSSAFLNELNRDAKQLINQAKIDVNLSAIGRKAKADEIKNAKGVELIQRLHQRKNQYIGHLKKARVAAKQVLRRGIEKPKDEQLIADFNKTFKDLKTAVMLAPSASSAEAKLKQFVSGIKDPYFASVVRDEFSGIVGHIISAAGGESAKYKMRLYDMYEGLERDFLSDEYREAQSIVGFADTEIERNKLFVGLVNNEPSLQMSSVSAIFGNDFAKYIDNTDQFFIDNEEAVQIDEAEVSDFNEETGDEEFSDHEILRRAEENAARGGTAEKIHLAMVKKELGL